MLLNTGEGLKFWSLPAWSKAMTLPVEKTLGKTTEALQIAGKSVSGSGLAPRSIRAALSLIGKLIIYLESEISANNHLRNDQTINTVCIRNPFEAAWPNGKALYVSIHQLIDVHHLTVPQ